MSNSTAKADSCETSHSLHKEKLFLLTTSSDNCPFHTFFRLQILILSSRADLDIKNDVWREC